MYKNIIALIILTTSFCFACSRTDQVQTPPVLVPIIQNNEVFELTMYNTVAEHPELVFRDYDYHGVYTRWIGKQTDACTTGQHRFKLVQIGTQPDLEHVRIELLNYGTLPCGQWIEALRFRFPLSDGLGNIGVADPAWKTSVWAGTWCSHPMLSNYYGPDRPWRPSWRWCNHQKFDEWRWLVQVD